MAFEAKNNFVFLLLDDKEEKVMKSGLIMPLGGPPPAEGRVVSAGPGKYDSYGRLIPNPVKVGDLVNFDKLVAHGVKIDGVEYVHIDADHIRAILEEEND